MCRPPRPANSTTPRPRSASREGAPEPAGPFSSPPPEPSSRRSPGPSRAMRPLAPRPSLARSGASASRRSEPWSQSPAASAGPRTGWARTSWRAVGGGEQPERAVAGQRLARQRLGPRRRRRPARARGRRDRRARRPRSAPSARASAQVRGVGLDDAGRSLGQLRVGLAHPGGDALAGPLEDRRVARLDAALEERVGRVDRDPAHDDGRQRGGEEHHEDDLRRQAVQRLAERRLRVEHFRAGFSAARYRPLGRSA